MTLNLYPNRSDNCLNFENMLHPYLLQITKPIQPRIESLEHNSYAKIQQWMNSANDVLVNSNLSITVLLMTNAFIIAHSPILGISMPIIITVCAKLAVVNTVLTTL